MVKLQGAENYKFDLNCRSDKADSLTWNEFQNDENDEEPEL